jgi:hypothetical protein
MAPSQKLELVRGQRREVPGHKNATLTCVPSPKDKLVAKRNRRHAGPRGGELVRLVSDLIVKLVATGSAS